MNLLTKEVDYRVCKWLLGCLEHDGVISADETQLAVRKLKERFNPPFLEVDVADGEIGDGVTVDEK
jgi:hypothetical protein